MAGSRPGRLNKGDRHTQSVRFPRDHAEVYAREADRLGLGLSDYVVREMALRHGLDLPDYLAEREASEQPPLAEAS